MNFPFLVPVLWTSKKFMLGNLTLEHKMSETGIYLSFKVLEALQMVHLRLLTLQNSAFIMQFNPFYGDCR